MRTTVYVEILPVRPRTWMHIQRVRVGRTWKRRPDADQLAGGAIVVEVEIDVPVDRMEHVVRATVPSTSPPTLVSRSA